MPAMMIETIVVSFIVGGVIGGVIGLQLSHVVAARRPNGR